MKTWWRSIFRLINKREPSVRGFTLIEALVAITIFAFFSQGIYLMYSQSMISYQTTAWKQDVAGQCEVFWNLLRKNLEEASNRITDIQTDTTITSTPADLIFRNVQKTDAGLKNGNLLSWVKCRHTLAGGLLHSMGCLLSLQDRNIKMEVKPLGTSSAPAGEIVNRIVLKDVDSFLIKPIPIWLLESDGEEYLSDAAKPNSTRIGSLLEISITFTPPLNSPIKGLSITQNNKIRINVGTQSSADPNFTPYH